MLLHNVHKELTKALHLYDLTLKAWSAQLIKPDGSIGVSSSMVIRCAQGREETEWLRKEIEQLISKAHEDFPDFYAFHEQENGIHS